MISAGFLMGMAALPGFPAAPFLILASAIGLIGYALWSAEDKTQLQAAEPRGAWRV